VLGVVWIGVAAFLKEYRQTGWVEYDSAVCTPRDQ